MRCCIDIFSHALAPTVTYLLISLERSFGSGLSTDHVNGLWKVLLNLLIHATVLWPCVRYPSFRISFDFPILSSYLVCQQMHASDHQWCALHNVASSSVEVTKTSRQFLQFWKKNIPRAVCCDIREGRDGRWHVTWILARCEHSCLPISKYCTSMWM